MSPACNAVRERTLGRWTIRELDETASTNDAARDLPPWHAVVARHQTRGRGRHGRSWFSGDGGLYLSAVVPTPGDHPEWAVLPLAAGLAVVQALTPQGIKGLRLRWPNDIMAGERKLGGILAERFHSDRAVAGFGINVTTCPKLPGPEADNTPVCLTDLAAAIPTLAELTDWILIELTRVCATISINGFDAIAGSLDALWDKGRRIRLDLDDIPDPVEGLFAGVDLDGSLLLAGRPPIPASRVRKLTELPFSTSTP